MISLLPLENICHYISYKHEKSQRSKSQEQHKKSIIPLTYTIPYKSTMMIEYLYAILTG